MLSDGCERTKNTKIKTSNCLTRIYSLPHRHSRLEGPSCFKIKVVLCVKHAAKFKGTSGTSRLGMRFSGRSLACRICNQHFTDRDALCICLRRRCMSRSNAHRVHSSACVIYRRLCVSELDVDRRKRQVLQPQESNFNF